MSAIECFTSSTATKIDVALLDTENHNQQNQEELKARIKQLEDRIKRLEEAGDALAYNHNPFTFIDWTKAKEAKL